MEIWNIGRCSGSVIEVISGKKLSEFMQEEIFEPLGMSDTAFWLPKEKQSSPCESIMKQYVMKMETEV